jgi:hypothetical protein
VRSGCPIRPKPGIAKNDTLTSLGAVPGTDARKVSVSGVACRVVAVRVKGSAAASARGSSGRKKGYPDSGGVSGSL